MRVEIYFDIFCLYIHLDLSEYMYWMVKGIWIYFDLHLDLTKYLPWLPKGVKTYSIYYMTCSVSALTCPRELKYILIYILTWLNICFDFPRELISRSQVSQFPIGLLSRRCRWTEQLDQQDQNLLLPWGINDILIYLFSLCLTSWHLILNDFFHWINLWWPESWEKFLGWSFVLWVRMASSLSFLCSIVYTSFLHSDCARFIVNQCNKQHRGRWTNVLGVDRRAPHSWARAISQTPNGGVRVHACVLFCKYVDVFLVCGTRLCAFL